MNILTAHLLNNVIAVFMLAPLVILYWRGGFMILQIYNTFHTYKYLAAFLEIAAGIAGGLMFSYTQVWMGKTSNRIRSPVAQLIIRRWYSYFFAWCVVCEWKGVWRLWDVVDAISGWETALYSLLVGLVPLLLTRCFRNTLAPPLATVSDLTETFFLIPTRFRTKRTSRIAHFLDNIFSMGIVIPLITSTWRGVWYLLDWLIVFPADVVAPERQLFWSYMISTLSGFAIAVIAVLLQKPSSVISAYLEQQGRWLSKIVFEDILMAVATFASIDLWRGVWGLYDEYFFPWVYRYCDLSLVKSHLRLLWIGAYVPL
ncbi:uncharacterized protein LOC129581190 isoform X2 [Paramacrobiotus metropolitanus]|uniref:uncharacterized protein LOC129581190 isoform X2 n=1 Tax=Paramacrobiotus metropolitanus TaxID=2943436 RepID=UPI0024463034|nr:uncharacterized protein LOC129581190 isoform X2 [Paramacrobiotus metropolitanus]